MCCLPQGWWQQLSAACAGSASCDIEGSCRKDLPSPDSAWQPCREIVRLLCAQRVVRCRRALEGLKARTGTGAGMATRVWESVCFCLQETAAQAGEVDDSCSTERAGCQDVPPM